MDGQQVADTDVVEHGAQGLARDPEGAEQHQIVFVADEHKLAT